MLQVGRMVCMQDGASVGSDVIGSALKCITTVVGVCGRMEVLEGEAGRLEFLPNGRNCFLIV